MTPSSIRGCKPGGVFMFRQGTAWRAATGQEGRGSYRLARTAAYWRTNRVAGRDTRLGDWDEERERPLPVEVPHDELSAEALRGVVESFVLREGTDYGERDVSHETKIAQVVRQLERGEARILFDPLDSSITIVVVKPGDRHRVG